MRKRSSLSRSSSSARLRSVMSRTKHKYRRPSLLKLANANLHREGGPVLALVAGLESDRFPGDHALLQALDGRIVETDVEIAFMSADQFFPAVAQTIAGLAVDVENGPILVKQKEGVSRVIHEGAEALLALAQLFLRLPSAP